MEKMEKYFSLLEDGGADLTLKINADTIKTAAWTIYRCKFGCNSYGKNHCCPPSCPTWKETQEMINCFQYGILFRCHEISIVTPLAVKVAKELFLDDYYKVIAFGSGSCERCHKCNPDHCNFPNKTVPLNGSLRNRCFCHCPCKWTGNSYIARKGRSTKLLWVITCRVKLCYKFQSVGLISFSLLV